ncbi:MAG: L-aspartate oxidase [Lachnospiraceae bacterium]|nr:L-aspartate oxidase [Lachnospiraceae bacterium]
MKTDILIAGSGCAGLYCALHLPSDKKVLVITKDIVEHSDSYLAQGGMCMLTDEDDYDSYFEDTMNAGHYENDKTSVEIMIKSSPALVEELLGLGVDFKKNPDGTLCYTREGAHSKPRIVFHKDVTGKEITSHLYEAVKKLPNVTIMEHTTLIDILEKDGKCVGGVIKTEEHEIEAVGAAAVVLATGGVGGVYRHSTNYRHLTGDGLAICHRHGVELKDTTYVQIHPTTFYSDKMEDRSFLISESVRGEGAKLYNKDGERFVEELLPRDRLTIAIREQMEKEGSKHVWEDLRPVPEEDLSEHFPNIVAHCAEKGYDVRKECIPIVPAQHYFMGGIKVNHESATTMPCLYAVGETACNGVHGRNRLASNSLLESLVFAGRAAQDIAEKSEPGMTDAEWSAFVSRFNFAPYQETEVLQREYIALTRQLVGYTFKE